MSSILAGLVDTLTAPHVEKVRVTDPATLTPETVDVVRAALLDDLEAAISGNIGGRGGSPIGPKIPLDAASLDLAEEIKAAVMRDLIRLTDRARYGTLTDLTLQWWAAYRADSPEHPYGTAPTLTVWIERMQDWEARIRAIVEPDKTMEVPGEECPVCGNTRIIGSDGTATNALAITFNQDDAERTLKLICRDCGPVALGSKAAAATLRIHKHGGEKSGTL